MDALQTILLALLQGLTEFLPISSSAHLILPAKLFGWADQGLAFDVAVHLGTLLAVMLYFRTDLWLMVRSSVAGVAGRRLNQEATLAWWVLLGTIPAGLAGFLANPLVEAYMRSTLVIALATFMFGLLLWLAERKGSCSRALESLGWRDVLIIGVAQMLALVPGTSRSGVTITAAMLLGYKRVAAARFSFLLSIPIIAAAALLKFLELLESGVRADWSTLSLGMGVAFVSAYLCIKWFLQIIDRFSLMPFVYYRLALAVILLLFFI